MPLRNRILIVAAASLCLARIAAPACEKTGCDKTDKSHILLVTSDGVSCKDAYVSIHLQHTIRWCAEKGNLNVFFDPVPPGTPKPYPKLVCNKPTECTSGPIDSNAKEGTYKYHVFLDGNEVDPNVIIDH